MSSPVFPHLHYAAFSAEINGFKRLSDLLNRARYQWGAVHVKIGLLGLWKVNRTITIVTTWIYIYIKILILLGHSSGVFVENLGDSSEILFLLVLHSVELFVILHLLSIGVFRHDREVK